MVCRRSPCLMHMLPALSTAVRRMVSCSVLIPRIGSHRLDPTISTVDGHNQPPLIIACTPRAKPAAVGHAIWTDHARRKRQRPRPCNAHAHHACCCMPCAWPRGVYVWVVWSLLVLSLRHRLIGIRNASHTRCISLSLVVVAQRSGSRDDWSAASPPQEPEAPLMVSAEETALQRHTLLCTHHVMFDGSSAILTGLPFCKSCGFFFLEVFYLTRVPVGLVSLALRPAG